MIIEINGYDLVGKTTQIEEYSTSEYLQAPRISTLPEIRLFSHLIGKWNENTTPDEYTNILAYLHAAKNHKLPNSHNIIIDRGFLTVTSDCVARYLCRGSRFDESLKKVTTTFRYTGFTKIGIDKNLDIPGSINAVMEELQRRKLTRENAQFTNFEQQYLPKIIECYRKLKEEKLWFTK